jgi:hypothetical protein
MKKVFNILIIGILIFIKSNCIKEFELIFNPDDNEHIVNLTKYGRFKSYAEKFLEGAPAALPFGLTGAMLADLYLNRRNLSNSIPARLYKKTLGKWKRRGKATKMSTEASAQDQQKLNKEKLYNEINTKGQYNPILPISSYEEKNKIATGVQKARLTEREWNKVIKIRSIYDMNKEKIISFRNKIRELIMNNDPISQYQIGFNKSIQLITDKYQETLNSVLNPEINYGCTFKEEYENVLAKHRAFINKKTVAFNMFKQFLLTFIEKHPSERSNEFKNGYNEGVKRSIDEFNNVFEDNKITTHQNTESQQ